MYRPMTRRIIELLDSGIRALQPQADPLPASTKPKPDRETYLAQQRAKSQAKVERIQALQSEGLSTTEIARRLGMHRVTIHRLLRKV